MSEVKTARFSYLYKGFPETEHDTREEAEARAEEDANEMATGDREQGTTAAYAKDEGITEDEMDQRIFEEYLAENLEKIQKIDLEAEAQEEVDKEIARKDREEERAIHGEEIAAMEAEEKEQDEEYAYFHNDYRYFVRKCARLAAI